MDKNKTQDIDYFDEPAFHPSLDIKNGVLVLGFRVKPKIDKESEIFIVATTEGQFQITKEPSFVISGKTYYIDVKKRKLAKFSQRLDRKNLDDFRENWLSPAHKINSQHLYTDIKDALKQHMDIEDADATLMCTWAIGTYFFPIFSAYPYLHIKAPKGSGKSQCLGFLNQICFNATKARASLPALRDTVDALRGTYLMDQADALHRPNMDDLLDILTDSYKRGGGDIRKMVADKGKNWNLQEFQAYTPKAFASINQLPEDLRDRCLIISLIRSSKIYKPLDEENAIWKGVRNDIYKLLISNFNFAQIKYDQTKTAYKHQEKPELVGRQLELWIPFEVMFSVLNIPETEQQNAKQQFLSQYNFAEYQVSDLERMIIEKVMENLTNIDSMVLRPKEIASGINEMYFDNTESAKQQSAQVGKIIHKFNLSSEKLPRDNKGERYLFKKEQVEKVYRGYFDNKTEIVPTPTFTDKKDPAIMA